jgi:hypothetical protein
VIIIAHRGNIDGPNPEKENHPDYILEAIKAGFDVEIDVWYVNGKYYLGHDEPQYEVEEKFLYQGYYWQHAKNVEALVQLMSISRFEDINCFFHNIDDYTLTSNGWIWTFPGKLIVDGSVAVMPERFPDWNISRAYGVCTDYPNKYIANNIIF